MLNIKKFEKEKVERNEEDIVMKKYFVMSCVFSAFAIVLSNVMCAVVSFRYCDMLYGIEYRGYSAPAEVAFVYAIPFVIGIALCAILAVVFYKKSRIQSEN